MTIAKNKFGGDVCIVTENMSEQVPVMTTFNESL